MALNGYNNGVKLLNDACSSLYGDETKGIEARSINIEDINSKLVTDPETFNRENYSDIYMKRNSTAYTEYKSYPAIYAHEKLSMINGTVCSEGLEQSEQSVFINASEGDGTGKNAGACQNASSIQPLRTALNFKDHDKAEGYKEYKTGATYYDLLNPGGSGSTYCVASRYTNVNPSYAEFGIYCWGHPGVGMMILYESFGSNVDMTYTVGLFPVVSVPLSILKGVEDDSFVVE